MYFNLQTRSSIDGYKQISQRLGEVRLVRVTMIETMGPRQNRLVFARELNVMLNFLRVTRISSLARIRSVIRLRGMCDQKLAEAVVLIQLGKLVIVRLQLLAVLVPSYSRSRVSADSALQYQFVYRDFVGIFMRISQVGIIRMIL